MTTKRFTVFFDEDSHSHSMTRTEAFEYLAACRAYQRKMDRSGGGMFVARLNDDGEWETVSPRTATEQRWAA